MPKKPNSIPEYQFLLEMSTLARTNCDHSGEEANLWTSEDPQERAAASKLCGGCIAFSACATSASELSVTFGVWAGKDYTKSIPDDVRKAS